MSLALFLAPAYTLGKRLASATGLTDTARNYSQSIQLRTWCALTSMSGDVSDISHAPPTMDHMILIGKSTVYTYTGIL